MHQFKKKEVIIKKTFLVEEKLYWEILYYSWSVASLAPSTNLAPANEDQYIKYLLQLRSCNLV